ncbi:MAG: thioesterase family protein [Lachnospiraceae bacterium]|nr:thioesterase family protein [Lachnospiraceae bacterium]
MLEAGIKGLEEMTVTPDDTAQVYKSGTLQVLATPRLAALMEETAWKSVAQALEPGKGTVGTRLELDHLAPTPVGMKVQCESVLEKAEGRKLVFSITAKDEKGEIGTAKHERFIVEEEKFQKKADQKNG